MWPPSSGSSGMKLNIPMKKLKPATRLPKKTSFSVTSSSSLETISPENRLPPTMLTGLSCSRSCTPTIALATPHTLPGSSAIACMVSTAIPPICSSV